MLKLTGFEKYERITDMKFDLPVTRAESNAMSCATIINNYSVLNKLEKQTWLKAAAAGNGCIQLAQPPDPNSIEINVYDEQTDAYTRCRWVDKDPFDS